MMFLFHIAITMGFIAFILSISLLIWGLRHQGAGVSLAKVLGSLIAVLSVIGVLCSGYYGIKYWHEGYFETPAAMEKVPH
ncbi:hypothetical protein LEAN103870_12780 [Legionella anisa]|uniref:Uncharacterized protein n=1 Tax=Legionella anisa TaxID=28082 RepID=A0AAX0WWT6_9GAMM|nr:hypothetical protein [Legionella anisa]AWN72383.1 hypothetical protein DLD14_00100 [Legionella anisa]KTC69078.1 hypothetical protein Lani_2806 [Legionella anisa]MBN5937020.1 hypothetical protein [Legionella anisa]MCW8423137.1 hypothetical protein [Legionella anisa]MCW8447775.1 hypothetical protein [Legionella anisa]